PPRGRRSYWAFALGATAAAVALTFVAVGVLRRGPALTPPPAPIVKPEARAATATAPAPSPETEHTPPPAVAPPSTSAAVAAPREPAESEGSSTPASPPTRASGDKAADKGSDGRQQKVARAEDKSARGLSFAKEAVPQRKEKGH